MSKRLVWDQTGQKTYETGVRKGVLFPQSSEGTYPKGVAWNGLTGVNEAPSGAEATAIYADDAKYLSLTSAEEFGATITAYSSPEEFDECDGSAEIADGVSIGQQERKPFGFCYNTVIGNDTKKNNYGYKIHIIYGATAKPSAMDYKTINDSPETIEMSWEISTTPVTVANMKPTATIVIDSTKADPEKLKALEDIIYGSEDTESRLPLPDEIATLMKKTTEPGGSSSTTDPEQQASG